MYLLYVNYTLIFKREKKKKPERRVRIRKVKWGKVQREKDNKQEAKREHEAFKLLKKTQYG